MKWISLLCLALSISSFTKDHSLYIGVIQITHEEETALASIQLRVFSDDLKSALQNAYGYDNIESMEQLCATHPTMIQAYFQEKLQFHINGVLSEIIFKNCAIMNGVHLIELTATSPSRWQKMEVKAPFFMELFPAQSNIINIHYKERLSAKEQKQFGRMTKGAPTLQFDF